MLKRERDELEGGDRRKSFGGDERSQRVNRETHAVEGDGTFDDAIAIKPEREQDLELAAVFDDRSDAIDMTLDKMSSQSRSDFERSLEIDFLGVGAQFAQASSDERLVGEVKIQRARAGLPYGETDPVDRNALSVFCGKVRAQREDPLVARS